MRQKHHIPLFALLDFHKLSLLQQRLVINGFGKFHQLGDGQSIHRITVFSRLHHLLPENLILRIGRKNHGLRRHHRYARGATRVRGARTRICKTMIRRFTHICWQSTLPGWYNHNQLLPSSINLLQQCPMPTASKTKNTKPNAACSECWYPRDRMVTIWYGRWPPPTIL